MQNEVFCFSNFDLEAGTLAARLAHAFSKELDRKGGTIVENAQLRKELIRVPSEYYIDINKWGYLATCHINYRRYLSALPTRTDYIQPAVCPEERLAVQIEDWLASQGFFQPVRPLDPSVVTYLRNERQFTNFALAYALGLLPSQNSNDPTQSACFTVDVGRAAGPVLLGEIWDMDRILSVYFEPSNTDVRTKVEEIWRTRLKSFQNDFSLLRNTLEQAARDLTLTAVPAGQADHIHRDDLLLAMKAAIFLYAKQIRG